VRCFVAVDVSPDVRAGVARVIAALRAGAPGADVRWVDPTAVHLTLKFLGAVPDERVPVVSAALGEAAAGFPHVALAAGGLGTFPGPARPRVVWVGITAGAEALAALAGGIDDALAPAGFAREARPFRGHVTIGRVRAPRALRTLVQAMGRTDALALGRWTAAEVVLYESRLRPSGAEHHVVSRHPLAPAHG